MTEVLACTGIGTYDQYPTLWGAPTKVAAVAAPDDDTTSGIGVYPFGVPCRQSFTLSASAIPGGNVIDDVAVRLRSTHGADPVSTYQAFVRLGGVEVYGPSIDPGVVWTTISTSLARPGGGPWQIADLAGTELGSLCDSGGYHYITTAELVITYHTPAATTGDMLLCMP